MRIPGGIKVFESEVFTVWIGEDGILYMNAKPVDISIQNAQRSFEVIEEVCKHKKLCCLADVSHIHYVNKAVRQNGAEFAARQFIAMAIISHTKFGALVANTVITINKPPLPIKIFSKNEEAKKWLKSYLEESNNER